eukprot:scaffold29178_cov51-Attheya_sp.AAC.1
MADGRPMAAGGTIYYQTAQHNRDNSIESLRLYHLELYHWMMMRGVLRHMLTSTVQCVSVMILLMTVMEMDQVHAISGDSHQGSKDTICLERRSGPWLDGVPTPLPLLSKTRISRDTSIFRFRLPDFGEPLGIGVCSCLLASLPHDRNVTRPYTPISSRHVKGYFDLLVKRYPNGTMSRALHDELKPGDPILFWQIPFNIKEQYPFGKPKTIVMLAAGTGITPMYQALQRLFGDREKDCNDLETKVYLIYGCRTAGDAYLRKEIESIQRMYPNRFSIVYVLSDEVDTGTSTGNNDDGIKTVVGQHMNKELLEHVCGSRLLKQKDCRVWVCGPPSFYNDLCGPREQTSTVGGALRSFGLKPKQVIKF